MDTSNIIVDGRPIVMSALVGSHNYNLHTPKSDRDYKFFVMPTFADLYYGKTFSTGEQSTTFDYTVHDIRQFLTLIGKANINFLEILFSRELTYPTALQPVFDLREEIVAGSLVAFKNATHGTFMQKISGIFKGTATTQPDVDRLGYDPKAAHHALRCLYTLERYAETGSFERAIWYPFDDPARKILLDVKAGVYKTYDDFYALVEAWGATKKEEVFSFYAGRQDNKDVVNTLNEFAFKFVRDSFVSLT